MAISSTAASAITKVWIRTPSSSWPRPISTRRRPWSLGSRGFSGAHEEEARYRQLALKIKDAFIERFLEPGTGRFGLATQAAQATSLHLGLVPNNEVEQAIQRMVDEVLSTHDGHIATGIFGTKYLLNALSAAGHADVAYGMVDEPSYPGWGYMLEQGATTVWETWAESDDVYSQNHPMFGSVSEWFYKYLAGIRPEEGAVGFDRFRIEPTLPAGLEWVETVYESVRGAIRSSWRLDEGLFYLDVEIPVNTTAVVQIPTGDPSSAREGWAAPQGRSLDSDATHRLPRRGPFRAGLRAVLLYGPRSLTETKGPP